MGREAECTYISAESVKCNCRCIMFLIVLFIVSNTIRLTFLMRRDEIEIMKLAGATNLFIKIPYVMEGNLRHD